MLARAKRNEFYFNKEGRNENVLDSALYKILTLDTQSMTSKTGSEKACMAYFANSAFNFDLLTNQNHEILQIAHRIVLL